VARGALRSVRGELRGADDDDLAHAHRRRGAEQLAEVLLLRHVVQHQKRDGARAILLAKPLRLLLGEHEVSTRRARDVLVLPPRVRRRRLRAIASSSAVCADDEGSDASGEGCDHQPLAIHRPIKSAVPGAPACLPVRRGKAGRVLLPMWVTPESTTLARFLLQNRPFECRVEGMSKGTISGAGPLQKRGEAPPGANAKVQVEAKPSSVQEWLDSRRNGAPAPEARSQPPGKSAAVQGGLTVNGAARRPSQPADSLDNFVTSGGKVANRAPSIFGGGGGALAPRVPSQRFQKISLADVWPDDLPGSGSQINMDEMDDALPSQPFGAQQHASRGQLHGGAGAGAGSRMNSAGSRAGAGARPAAAGPFDMSPFGAGQPDAPSHGRRSVGSMQARYGMAPGAMAAGGGAGRRCGGGAPSTRPW
jgi:hypothetical protein